MKKFLFTNLFMVVALFTSASIFAQAANSTVQSEIDLSNASHYKYVLLQVKNQDQGDIESEREVKESERLQLSKTINNKRVTGRQFKIDDDKLP